MESLLAGQTEEMLDAAQLVYKEGGNSKSFAVLSITGGLSQNIAAGTKLTATGKDERSVVGTALVTANSGEPTVSFKYPVTDTGDDHLDCRVGGLPENEHVTDGCKLAFALCFLITEYSRIALTCTAPRRSHRFGRRWQPHCRRCLHAHALYVYHDYQ